RTFRAAPRQGLRCGLTITRGFGAILNAGRRGGGRERELKADNELFRSSNIRVSEEWIDYNGHLNTAWYHYLFDQGADEALDQIELGPREIPERNKTIFTVQFHIHHRR